ncbi:putative glycoside hydrolase [Cohnella silvisoli]|uniref:Glycoside hydrolase n=1 Tax=Cohnella silvisoli TaxID=2873699 RepID=A0ABV1KSH4_9BACL|nr:putative glycoside hydrolase [Cohnella silvisoli]MCD9022687.1 putative glycoside hydrolase [Cohnella silvisoli]
MDDDHKLNRSAALLILFLILGCAMTGCGSAGFKALEQKVNEGSQDNAKSHSKAQFKLNASKSSVILDDNRPVSIMKTTSPIRAIYVSSHVANSRRMKELIGLVDQTELNAMVLDVNSGISLSSAVQSEGKSGQVHFVPSNKRSAQHYRQVIKQLKNHHIYLIARIVTFKNPSLAEVNPAWALKRKDGKLWRDRNGTPWIDPFRQEAWEYPIALAEHAAKIGFDEIQYDYVRFPENGSKVDREVAYANKQGWTKSEAVRRFLHRATIRAHKYGARVSADVFGMVGSSNDDMGIGQKWDAIAKEVDVISPMIYPSHYSKGMWGIDNPDLSPSPIITRALMDTAKHNRKLNQQGFVTARVRPWLQGFTAGWVHPHQKYGAAQIREQIQAARKAGFNSYMIWNSANKYSKFNA